jgi:solute carrier family 25 (mitochondrial thiamine pyrophosphate transporter), member 19
LQLQSHSIRDAHTVCGPTYTGTLHAIKTIARDEGLTALWKGNVPAEVLYLAYGAAQFYAYRNAHLALDATGVKLPEAAQSMIAGTLAGSASTLVTYPLDLLRTRFALQGTERVYASLPNAVSHIWAHEGISGFFRGAGAAVIQIGPNFGVFFAAYEPTKALISRVPSASGWENAVAGATASTVAKLAIYPLDLARKRMQAQGPMREQYVHRNIPVYTSSWNVLVNALRTEGVRGWYKGLTVSLVKAAPNSAVTMWVYEQTMKFLRKRRENISS